MREFKNALIGCTCIVFFSVAGIAIWTVRAYLPVVGIMLLIVLVLGVVLVLAFVVEFLHRRYFRYEPVQISQYGTVLHRRNEIVEIAPYQPSTRAMLPSPQQNASDDQVIDADPVENEGIPELPAPLLTFAQMLESGIIQSAIKRGQIVLGYEASSQTLRYGSWLDLYSAGNGGVSGSGKSTTTRFLLFQGVLAGAKLIMIDPHIGEPDESLSHQFSLLPANIHQIKPCDNREENLSKRVAWLKKELVRRENTGHKTPFLIFVIDEFNTTMRRASKEMREQLADLLLDIEQGGRKFGIFALLIGQRWSANDLGGADIRTSLASKMAHRFSDEDQAKRFIGSKYARQLLELETGHWLFYDTKGRTAEMITPETYATDGAKIARILTGGAASEVASNRRFSASETASMPPLYLVPDVDPDAVTEPLVEPVDALNPQSVQVLNLLKNKRGQNEIIEEVWGYKSSDGRPYRTALDEYRVILATLASKIGA